MPKAYLFYDMATSTAVDRMAEYIKISCYLIASCKTFFALL